MVAAEEVRTPRARTGWWRFLRHYLEMVAAMLAGMLVLGGAVRGVLALAGQAYPTRYPELAALEMAVDMSVGMAAWMRYRGHGWAVTLEMVAAMFAPLAALFPLLWLGAIAGDALLILEHVVMLPLMFLVMLRRRAEYGAP
jgi:flagellar biosynthetic protein FliP